MGGLVRDGFSRGQWEKLLASSIVQQPPGKGGLWCGVRRADCGGMLAPGGAGLGVGLGPCTAGEEKAVWIIALREVAAQPDSD